MCVIDAVDSNQRKSQKKNYVCIKKKEIRMEVRTYGSVGWLEKINT